MMRESSYPKRIVQVGVVLALLAGCAAALISATTPPFSPNEKAYYLDERTASFVRPGFWVKVYSASVAEDGTIKCRVKIQDRETGGIPLDRLGMETPGTISLSFIAAYIPKDADQYVALTTRSQTSTITGKSAIQASGESNGTWTQLAIGDYEYTFRAKAPAGFDRSQTFSIGAYGSRNLSDFELPTYYDDDVFTFVPNGAAVTKVRDLIRTETCNKCHGQLAFHGGSRRTMELCNLCHTPQTIDPDTGNTVDMPVMTHKIHAGNLLSKGYTIIGFGGAVHDYSGIVMPSNVKACSFCHEPGKATQADRWLTKPSRVACGSCHDNVNFATGENHAGGLPQFNDNSCTQCHQPEGEIDFDASIKGAHVIAEESSLLPGVVYEILKVSDGVAGKAPTVQFSVKNKKGEPYDLSKFSRLALVLAGPSSDYTTYYSEDPRARATGSGGVYTYTFTNKIPADAKGTWTIGIEGYNNVTLLEGTVKQVAVRDAGINKTFDFSVDGSPVAPRRVVATTQTCNSCHRFLSLHGGNRNTVEQCVLCHNPVSTDAARRPATAKPDESIDMALMIHRIHAGHLQERDYTIYGFGNVPHNYNHVGYPNDLRNCTACHTGTSYRVPLARTTLAKKDPRGYLDPVMPATGACTGCHTSLDAASHALANTTVLGESCGACHGVNREYSVDKVHAH